MLDKVRVLLATARHVRLEPFETDTEAGRAAERYRRALLGSAANVVSRGLGLALLFAGVYLTPPYLGSERFGVWATFAGSLAMLGFLDLGIGNALVNRVAQTKSRRPGEAATVQVISGGVVLLMAVALAASLTVGAIASSISWKSLFKLSGDLAAEEARRTALVFVPIFCVSIISSGLAKILIGQQRAWEAHFWNALFTLLALLALVAASKAEIGVPGLLWCTSGVQALSGMPILFLLHRRKQFAPRAARSGAIQESRVLFRDGLLFLLLQLAAMAGWGADSFILASVSGATAVAAFAVTQRLFQLASQPIAVLNAPLWPAYSDAKARGDRIFLRATLRGSLVFSSAAGLLLAVTLSLSGQFLIARWTTNTVQIPGVFLGLFGAWTVLEIVGNAFAMYLNGVGIVQQQAITAVAFALVALPLKLTLTASHGMLGLVCGTIIAYLLTTVGFYATVFRAQILAPLR